MRKRQRDPKLVAGAMAKAKGILESVAEYLDKEGIPYRIQLSETPESLTPVKNPDAISQYPLYLKVDKMPGRAKDDCSFELFWSPEYEPLEGGEVFAYGSPVTHEAFFLSQTFDDAGAIIHRLDEFMYAKRISCSREAVYELYDIGIMVSTDLNPERYDVEVQTRPIGKFDGLADKAAESSIDGSTERAAELSADMAAELRVKDALTGDCAYVCWHMDSEDGSGILQCGGELLQDIGFAPSSGKIRACLKRQEARTRQEWRKKKAEIEQGQ